MLEEKADPPAFNVPRVLLALAGAMAAIHLLRQFLAPDTDLWVLYAFGFVPGRYAGGALDLPFPLGIFGDVLGFATYALLHGNWLHLISNLVWMLAFGAPVSQRFGARRFLAFGAVCAVAGALAHLATHWGEMVPMVGASAAISGFMAGAIRFAFTPGGPLTASGRFDREAAVHVPAVGMVAAFRNRSVIGFTLVWMVFNLLLGLGAVTLGEGGGSIAWQAHVGGFFAGLIFFDWFDPVGREVREG